MLKVPVRTPANSGQIGAPSVPLENDLELIEDLTTVPTDTGPDGTLMDTDPLSNSSHPTKTQVHDLGLDQLAPLGNPSLSSPPGKTLPAAWGSSSNSKVKSQSNQPKRAQKGKKPNGQKRQQPPTKTRKSSTAEDAAYERFLKQERLKTIWVVIGVLVGLGISIGVITANSTFKKIKEEKRPTSKGFE